MKDYQKLINEKLVKVYGTFSVCQKKFKEFDFENRGFIIDLMQVTDYISPLKPDDFIQWIIDNDKVLLFNAAVMYLIDMKSGKIYRNQIPLLQYMGKTY
jgi:hypothetical protein